MIISKEKINLFDFYSKMVKLNEILSFESKVDFCITKNAVGTSILLKEKWPIEYERPLSKNLSIN